MHKRSILVTHSGSQVLLKSAAYLRNIGYEVIEADSDQSCLELIARQKPPLVLCNLKPSKAGVCRCYRQLENRTANGRPFVAHFSKMPPHGGDAAVSPSVDEVLPLPKSPAELLPWIKMFFRCKDREDLHCTIAGNTSDTIMLADDLGRITYASSNVHKLFGYTASEVRQIANIAQLVGENLFSTDVLEARGEILNIKTTIATKDGRRRPVLIDVNMVDMIDGTHCYTCRDIPKTASDDDDIKAAFEHAPLGILLHGADGRLSDVNPTLCEMIGLPRKQLLKHRIDTFLDDKSLQTHQQFRNELTDGAVTRCRYQSGHRRLSDGAYRDTEVHWAEYDIQGQSRFMAIVNDITDRRQIEEQLYQSNKMKAIGTLAGGIAHEFNNILGIIIGNTELAADEISSANLAQEFLVEIRTASRRAKDVVRKILSFARKTTHDPKPVRIGPLVEEAARFLRPTISTRVEIRTRIKCHTETIFADATEMNQVLMNLFANAAHAMPEHQGIIDVSLDPILLDETTAAGYNDLKPGAYVRLKVSDNGTGIAAKNIAHIFLPYFTTKEINQGTGMGLAIVYGIVKKHGGDITVRSKVGVGTTMTVVLPVVATVMDLQEETPAVLPTGSESILVVDDEHAFVRMVETTLNRLGYNVRTTTSGNTAIEMVTESPDYFDMVITGMAMPKMSGDELARRVIKIRKNLPVILCTGHSESIDEAGAKAMGISAFILKPIEKQTLAETVRQLLDRHG